MKYEVWGREDTKKWHCLIISGDMNTSPSWWWGHPSMNYVIRKNKRYKQENEESYCLNSLTSESLFFKTHLYLHCKSINPPSFITMKLALQVTVLAIIGAAASAHELRGSPLSVRWLMICRYVSWYLVMCLLTLCCYHIISYLSYHIIHILCVHYCE